MSQNPHFRPDSSLALPSPNSISVVRRDRWQRVGLAGSSPSPLSYFHKPIIADHLGRLRPCLSPSQPGRQGGELGAVGLGGQAPRPAPAPGCHGNARREPSRPEPGRGVWGWRGRAPGCTHLSPGGGGSLQNPAHSPSASAFLGSRRLSCHQPRGC